MNQSLGGDSSVSVCSRCSFVLERTKSRVLFRLRVPWCQRTSSADPHLDSKHEESDFQGLFWGNLRHWFTRSPIRTNFTGNYAGHICEDSTAFFGWGWKGAYFFILVWNRKFLDLLLTMTVIDLLTIPCSRWCSWSGLRIPEASSSPRSV